MTVGRRKQRLRLVLAIAVSLGCSSAVLSANLAAATPRPAVPAL